MVDCGSPRCAQGRRSFRRDLQLWGKKLPVIVGLERIAADYVDKETSALLLNPYPAWEKCMTDDFEPAKKCFHCDKKLPNIYKRIQRIVDEAKRGKVGSGKICLRSLQDLMPFCLDFYKHGFGHELFSDCVKEYFINATTVSAEPSHSHPHNHSISDVHQASLSSSTGAEASSQKIVTSLVRTSPGDERLAEQSATVASSSSLALLPSSSSSSSSVLAPGDNNLNRLRVPDPTAGRSKRKNEWQQQDFEKQETFSKSKEDVFGGSYLCQSDFPSNKKFSSTPHVYIHSKVQDTDTTHPYHSLNQSWPPFAVHLDDHLPPRRKRRLSHPHNERVEVIISDSEEEGAESYHCRSRNRQHKDYRQLLREQQQKRDRDMSALELFESAHRRLRLEQLEQLGQLGRLDHEQQQQLQQQHLDGLCTAASASLFRLANQHLLPPGLEQRAFSAAAAAAVAPSSPALPFLLPILPCSLKLKLESGDDPAQRRRHREDKDSCNHGDDFDMSHLRNQSNHLSHHRYFDQDSYSLNNSSLLASSGESFDMLEQRYRLEQLRRMHNLNGVVKDVEHRENNSKDHYNPWSTKSSVSVHDDSSQHDFYQKELKLPLLTDLVRKLVHQKFEEITQRTRKASRCANPREKSPEASQTHLQRLLLQQRNDDSFVPFNPYMTPVPSHFMATMASEDETIATPMYKHIMESIYNGMMKEETIPVTPKPFGKVNESGRVGDALKDIITKNISEKMHFTDASLHKENVSSTAVPESLQNRQAAASSSKPQIWSPALSAVCSNTEAEETKTDEGDKDIASPPPKRPKKESNGSSNRNKPVSDRRATAQSASVATSTETPASGGKKTRPKRGQYRKYNSQLLMDAVKAVQRGEMSVHRAGSFYGVPHSTLEYKVKERHLLRQKKPREAAGSPDSKTASEASSPPPPASSASPRLSIRTPSKAARSGRTRSQDSSSPYDGDSSACGSTTGPPSSSKKQCRKAVATNDSSSPRSSVSSSTSPSPAVNSLPPAPTSPVNPKPILSAPASPLTPSLAKPSSPPLLSSPDAVTDNKDINNSLSSNLAWFQPYLETSPGMQQILAAPASSSNNSPSSLPLEALAHTNSASELLRKLQFKVQAKGSGVALRSGSFSPPSHGGGGTLEFPCGQDKRGFEIHRHALQHGGTGGTPSLQDRLMLYKQSA